LHGNVLYNNNTLKKYLLNIYLHVNAKGKIPLVVFIHGSGWVGNDKYTDMAYTPNTVNAILDNGFAVASIDYLLDSCQQSNIVSPLMERM
jgi:acetyl esterase/lipase